MVQLPPDYVADSEVDWLDLGDLSVRAASVRGHLHRFEGTIRQDSFALGSLGDFLLLAVSDGVGSSSHSHLGSRSLTQRAVRADTFVADATAMLDRDFGVILRELTALQDELVQISSARGLEPRDLSATLLVAAVQRTPVSSAEGCSRYGVALWNVGDSEFLKFTEEGIEHLAPPGTGVEGQLVNSSVQSLPLQATATLWVEYFKPGETLALVTDGVGNIVSSNRAFRDHLHEQWRGGAPAPADLLTVIDATVKSFDDDRTMAAVRFPADMS